MEADEGREEAEDEDEDVPAICFTGPANHLRALMSQKPTL
jgi:hypothetical protein